VDGFHLSPGITPLLTDLFVAAVPLALGIGYLLGRSRGVETALGGSAVALGLVKLFTDYPDLRDDLVAFAALLAGLAFLSHAFRPDWSSRIPRLLAGVGAAVLLLVGAYKIYSDFYDPFDVLLADLTILGGVAAGSVAAGHRPTTFSPTGNRPDGTDRPASGCG
jgi:hypothetical protein